MITEKKLRSFYPELQTLYDVVNRLRNHHQKSAKVRTSFYAKAGPKDSWTSVTKETFARLCQDTRDVVTSHRDAYKVYCRLSKELRELYESSNSST